MYVVRQERAIRYQQQKTDREEVQMKATAVKQAAQAEAEARRTATQRFDNCIEFWGNTLDSRLAGWLVGWLIDWLIG